MCESVLNGPKSAMIYVLSLGVSVVLSSWMCESVLMPLYACYVVLLSPLVLMVVRVRLEWMFAMMCYVVLLSLLCSWM